MSTEEQRELLIVFMAALRAVVPDVTDQQRTLVQEVVDGMLRERSIGAVRRDNEPVEATVLATSPAG